MVANPRIFATIRFLWLEPLCHTFVELAEGPAALDIGRHMGGTTGPRGTLVADISRHAMGTHSRHAFVGFMLEGRAGIVPPLIGFPARLDLVSLRIVAIVARGDRKPALLQAAK